ncbi:hypothetical protein HG531_008927 [Fusarium graminearum]|nr:hypothetical protein HG531_008927 [Fusarium graminearum]
MKQFLSILKLDTAISSSADELTENSGDLVHVVEHDKAADVDTRRDKLKPVLKSHGLIRVIDANGAADGDVAVALNAGQHSVEDEATDVVKVNIDLVGGNGLEVLKEGRALVVDALVGTDALNPLTLLIRTGNTNDSLGLEDLGSDLNSHGASGTSGGRDNNGVLRLGLTGVVKTSVGGKTRSAKGAEEVGGGETIGEGSKRLGVLSLKDSILAPDSEVEIHAEIADLELVGSGLDDLGDDAGSHRRAYGDGRNIEALRGDSAMHKVPQTSIVGKVLDLDEDLTILKLGKSDGLQLPGSVRAREDRLPCGLVGQDPLLGRVGG